jgi:hypothetical protein
VELQVEEDPLARPLEVIHYRRALGGEEFEPELVPQHLVTEPVA